MRKIILAVLLFFITMSIQAQVYPIPFVLYRDVPSVAIKSVEIQPTQIKIVMEYLGYYESGWIRISPDVKLINHTTKQEARLIKAENIGHKERETIVNKKELHTFTLYFSKININVSSDKLSIIEGKEHNDFNFYNIDLTTECPNCKVKDETYTLYLPSELEGFVKNYLRSESDTDLRVFLRNLKNNLSKDSSIEEISFFDRSKIPSIFEDVAEISCYHMAMYIAFEKGSNGKKINHFRFIFDSENYAREFFKSISLQGNYIFFPKAPNLDVIQELNTKPNPKNSFYNITYFINKDENKDIWEIEVSAGL